MQIKFCGAARTVTGSSHLLQLNDGYRILLDCGMFQGNENYVDNFNAAFEFDPKDIDILLLSHAHIDHSGRIPKLVKEGFRGKIVCTAATKDLCEIMLRDSAHIQESDAKYVNKKRAKRNLPPISPLYSQEDAEKAMQQFVTVNYETPFSAGKGVKAYFRDNGHIIGSGSILLTMNDGGTERKIGFTGDIGRPNRPILKDPIRMEDVDYLISESTYGGRFHESYPDDKEYFLSVILDTCIKRKGKLIIPAFSIGRTQELVFMMDQLHKEGRLPHLPVYVDSPLSTNATEIYRRHTECFDEFISRYLLTDANPFGFNDLKYITDAEESKALNLLPEPCIIISASGMAEAGRIVHHIKNNMEDARNTILIVGYCAEQSLGWKIRKGISPIRLFGEEKTLRAKVEIMDSFSAHGDHNELLQFLDNLNRNRLKKLFLVHGDFEAQLALKKGLEKNGFQFISMPEKGEVKELAF
ncbi:MAG: MBL fold metallo-hydrolase [Chitinophagales bacterium]|nr:MBL fold metallo-hydrolase [Chitinophagales bacterium]